MAKLQLVFLVGSCHRVLLFSPEYSRRLLRQPPKRCYDRPDGGWARRWSAVVDRRIGFADQTLRTLYHGDRRHRRYLDWRDILLRHDFDPPRDLALGENACWRWNSNKPELHAEVADYFLERREDA